MSPGDRQRPTGAPQGGFGGSPWTEAGLPADGNDPSADTRAPFGGDGWAGSPGLAADSAEALPEPEKKSTGRRRRSKGPTHTRHTLAALGSPVDVFRDENAVAHAYAKTERDAYAALGFCMAEDRLFQMDFFRRRANGRSAELVGKAGARHDALVRTVGLPRRAAAAASRMEGVARDLLAAFAGGVNAARAVAKPAECERLGYQIEPWTIADSLAIELYLAWTCAAATWPEKILVAQALASGGVDRARSIAASPVDFVTSSDDRTALWARLDCRIVDLVNQTDVGTPMGHVVASGASGPGLLGATFELLSMTPSPLYPVSLDTPDFKVVGLAHVGTPGLMAGRNEQVAWGVTGARLDDADCVMEELDGIGNFRTEAGWEKLSRRREMVRVREGETLRLEVAETRHGPLVSHLMEQLDGPSGAERPMALALCWGANSLGTALPGLAALARAGSTDEVVESESLFDRSPLVLDVAAVDRSGSSVRLLAGTRPTRDPAARLPVRGWMSEGRWSGMESMPDTGAPVEGGVVVATGVTGEGGNEAVLRYRAARLAECARHLVEPDSLDAISKDVADTGVASVLPRVRAILDTAGPGGGVDRAREALDSWDGEASESSRGAAIFYVALSPHLIEGLLPESRLGPVGRCRELAWAAVLRILGSETPTEEQRTAILSAFARAEQWLVETLGEEPRTWTWGRVLSLQSEAPCPAPDEPPPTKIAASGSPFTVLGQRFMGAKPPFRVDVGMGARIVVDLSKQDTRITSEHGESVIRLGEKPTSERVELVSG